MTAIQLQAAALAAVTELSPTEIDQVSGGSFQWAFGGGGLSANSQLSMIQLQSVLSQRQQAVQMTTSLLSSMSDTAKTVADNIR